MPIPLWNESFVEPDTRKRLIGSLVHALRIKDYRRVSKFRGALRDFAREHNDRTSWRALRRLKRRTNR